MGADPPLVIVERQVPGKGEAEQRGVPWRDEATCTWQGVEYRARSKSGACMKLARILIEAGCPDGPWETRTPEGMRSLYGPSLWKLAKLMVSEGDKSGLKRRAYIPPADRHSPRPKSPASGSEAAPASVAPGEASAAVLATSGEDPEAAP